MSLYFIDMLYCNNIMKIILIIEDSKGKNIVFVSDKLESYLLEDVIKLTKQKQLPGICLVNRNNQTHLRTTPNKSLENNLSELSISSSKFFKALDDLNLYLKLPGLNNYWNLYQDLLHKQESDKKKLIIIDGYRRVSIKTVKEKITPHDKLIFEAANKFSIDPYLLGAIIIDEISRAIPLEHIFDSLLTQFVGLNASAGIAQVKIETARSLIKNDYYNPSSKDDNFSKNNISKTSRSYILKYVQEPKHSIYFSSAQIKFIIDTWKLGIDISNKPEIIATLYSLGEKKSHSNPKPNERGLQIVNEFYPLAKKFLIQ